MDTCYVKCVRSYPLLLGVVTLICGFGVGAETTTFNSDSALTQQEIIEALSGDDAGGPSSGASPAGMGTTRGIEKQRPPQRSVDFRDHINFEFGSANLTPSAEQALNEVGQALNSEELRGRRFVIEGHTDSVGSSKYNQELSERRAQAAKSYLTEEFGIDAQRLRSVGRGEGARLSNVDPESPMNRRVVVIALP